MKKLFKKFAGLMMGLLAVAGLAGIGANSNEAPVKAEAASTDVWSLVGSVNGWDPADKTYDFKYVSGNNQFELIISLSVGDNFKIVKDHKWETEIGYAGNTGVDTYLSADGDWYDYGGTNVKYANFKVKSTNTYLIALNVNVSGYGNRSYGVTISTYTAPINEFTITYMDGINALDSDVISEGEKINPPLIEKEGYMLEGFYVDSTLLTPFKKGTLASSDLTLYAKYVESKDHVIYFNNTNGWETVYVHYWADNIVSESEWPGSEAINIAGSSFWYYEVDAEKSYNNVIWNNNNNKKQTDDIALEGSKDGDVYILGEISVDGGENNTTKYETTKISSIKTFAHITGETIPAYNGLGDTGLKAESNGVSVVKLSKTGFTFDAEATAALTDEEKKNVVIDYIDNLSTCDVFQNCELYEQLVDSIDPNLKSEIISETYDNQTNEITIGEKLEYMETYKAWNDAHPNDNKLGSNLLTNLTSSNNTLIVLIVGLLGLTAVGAYYFLNKKKFAK